MTTVATKIKKAFYISASGALLLIVFIVDFIRGSGSVDIEFGWISFIRNLFVAGAFLLFYLLLESLWKKEQGPAKKLGFVLVLMIVVVVMSAILSFVSTSGFDEKNAVLIPLGFDAVVFANIFGVVLGTTMLVVLLVVRDIMLWKRRKGTRRNVLLLIGGILVTALSTLLERPLDSNLVSSFLFGGTILLMLLNSFRLSWIVYLTKREKLFSMIYGFLLFSIFIGLDILVSGDMSIGKSLLFYSPLLKSFIASVSVFATIYFGMTFLSTMFHLPTAEAYDRKNTEVTSLHNLSRLITQVFDFNELVDSVTRMTLEVCQAQSSWLEIIHEKDARIPAAGGNGSPEDDIQALGLRNISREEIQTIIATNDGSLRTLVHEARKPVVIDDVREDKRTRHLANLDRKFGSMVIVPLRSHDVTIGILYATKEAAFGFDQEDVDLISAFADQATIAIENSRLIEKSLERERLVREMMLAQEMQKKLLPQHLPQLKELELEALSTPAFEVGGDYYDFTMLDEHRLGIIVGDVSGKGVSAAFYMAEMKGIFQSLSRIYPTPKDFLVQAHRALSETIDKRSFISVIYAVLDLRDGTMAIARAGHCPMLYVSGGKACYIQPVGMGLGMGKTEVFERTIIQQELRLTKGDVAVFFTDGITEARPPSGEEYGYQQLLEVGQRAGSNTAIEIRDVIISDVDRHMGHQPPEDDLTLIVIKWLG